MNAQIISIMLTMFNVAANAIPLINRKNPNTKIDEEIQNKIEKLRC